VKDLLNEKYKPLKKERVQKMERSPMLMDRINIVKMAILLKTIYTYNAIPSKFQLHSSEH
jgi:hypothetical protein